MKILTYFIFFILIGSNLKAIEMFCEFEEVYKDGTAQTGFFLIKDEKMRYEYDDPNLITIFHTDKGFYLIRNNKKNIFQKIDQNTEVLNELFIILNSYPNIPEAFEKDGFIIKIEKSLSNNFIKRISLKSEAVNLSINIHNCQIIQLNDKYFSYNPMFVYR